MKVLVCGGRDYNDYGNVKAHLDALHDMEPITEIIHGGASGADTLAGLWATQNNVKLNIFPAEWEKHGRAAGPIRNTIMLEVGKPELVLAFRGGRGTANMVKQAEDAGVEVMEAK